MVKVTEFKDTDPNLSYKSRFGIIAKVSNEEDHYYVVNAKSGVYLSDNFKLVRLREVPFSGTNVLDKVRLWFKYHNFPNMGNVRPVGCRELRSERYFGLT